MILAWAAGDMQAQGFLLGATAGRTTLAGEGLQHQDGHSHLLAATIPNCRAYDPTFSYEVAVIMQHGLKQMYRDQERVFYYLTLMNENYEHPEMPKGVEDEIIQGMYLFKAVKAKAKHKVQLLGSGTIFIEVLKAAEILEKDYNVSANIWSVTSFNELRRNALVIQRENLFKPEQKPAKTYVETCLGKLDAPVIAATDYIRSFADQIRQFVPHRYTVLGTDGYGRSDTRKALRHFFEVDAKHIAYATLKTLFDEGEIKKETVLKAREALGVNPDKINPVSI